MIPYGRQSISEDDIRAVEEVLRSDFLTQGPVVPRFEATVAERCGAKHAVAVNSATSALHLACLALGVGPGDRVWTSPITFVASANCARYCGADVDFVDIDLETANMSVEALERKLSEASANGTLPKAIIPVHFAGRPCDMRRIGNLARHYGCRIIEDASHALGATHDGQPVGACTYSDITVFSFHPVKIITTGEGGMALTQDEKLARTMRLLRSHGVTRDPDDFSKEAAGPWYYEQTALGFNYRMSDIAAALGISQFLRISAFQDARRRLAHRYDRMLAPLPLTPLQRDHGQTRSALHLYVVLLSAFPKTKKDLIVGLRAAGVGAQVHYIPLHLQPYNERLEATPSRLPCAEDYYYRALSLPLFPDLTDEQQDLVVNALKVHLQ